MIEIRAEKIVQGGAVLGRLPDGRAVFVPFGLPGELLQIELTEERKRHAFGRIVKILEPSPERIDPRCIHYGVCGGCHFQHMSYAAQLDAKRAILVDQLERLANIQKPAVVQTVPGPSWNYRNFVQFHLAEDGRLGYVHQNQRQVLPIQECHLPETEINALWPQFEFVADSPVHRVGIRRGADEEFLLILEGSLAEPPELLVEELPISVVLVEEDDLQVLAGSLSLVMEIGGRSFQVSGNAFFQVNKVIAEQMITHLQEILPWNEVEEVWEIYSGAGLFSAFLAEMCRRLVCIEASALACEDFSVNLDEFEHVSLYEGPAEEIVPHLDGKPDVIVLDPPRSGLDVAVVDAILEKSPRWVIYIACDPATMARDGRRLATGGYRLVLATPFDMFPQTYHIESIGLWQKAG